MTANDRQQVFAVETIARNGQGFPPQFCRQRREGDPSEPQTRTVTTVACTLLRPLIPTLSVRRDINQTRHGRLWYLPCHPDGCLPAVCLRVHRVPAL